jgi:hypothetical protein
MTCGVQLDIEIERDQLGPALEEIEPLAAA